VEQETVAFFKGVSFRSTFLRVFEYSLIAIVFPSDQAALFSASVDDPTALPWELVHIVSISLEAFSLLELGIEQRLDEMAANKLPEQVS
jgi:hypothetical protein